MHRILVHHTEMKEHSMPLSFYNFILLLFTITVEATSSGAVISGTVLGVIALMSLVILLLGCLIYYQKRKSRKLHIRYSVILYASLKMTFVIRNASL